MENSLNALTKSLNEVLRLSVKKDKKSTLRAEEMRRSLQSSCDAINKILNEEKLFNLLAESKESYETIVKDLIIFNRRFVSEESTILKKYGVSYNAKKSMIRQTRNRRKKVSLSDDYREMLKTDLEETRDIINNHLEMLNDSSNKLASKKVVQNQWKRISYLVGGAALVAINATLSSSQPAISAVSATFGTTMITDNLKRK